MSINLGIMGVILLIMMLCMWHVEGAGANKDPRRKISPRKEDAKRVMCDVCGYMADHMYNDLKGLNAKGKRDEDTMIQEVEKSTTAWRLEGEWITKLYLEGKKGGKLKLKNKRVLGECEEACKTVEYAAQQVMGEHDAEVGEALYMKKYKSAKEFKKWFCETLTHACPSKYTDPLPESFVPYPAFTRKDPSDQNLDRMLGEMADQGLRGNVFSREEALEKYRMEAGIDEDEDMPFPDEL